MKHFFSIELKHEYGDNTAHHLSIVPATSNEKFVNNNRVLFRRQVGYLDCFIEEDESLKNDVEVLYFWVVCIDEAFYSYTDYPIGVSFSEPYYYWSNSEPDTIELGVLEMCRKLWVVQTRPEETAPGKAPKDTIGCIGIATNEINANKKFTIWFKVKKTVWQYRIYPKETQAEWKYKIEDKKKEWDFEDKTDDGQDTMTFQSSLPIPYFKKATSRLKLIWSTDNKFQEEQEMTLPFANYAYKIVDKTKKELTPIYIHI